VVPDPPEELAAKLAVSAYDELNELLAQLEVPNKPEEVILLNIPELAVIKEEVKDVALISTANI
jgi:hypothetical protein